MKALFSRAAAAATLAAAALSAPALAQDTPVFEFRVERASLVSGAGVSRAYQRLKAEAGRYCRALDLEDARSTARCRFDIVEGVIEAAGHDRLSTYHREQLREDRMAAAGR
ncbi:MAG: UrcA family protein [Oceanicaulis sp.]